MPFQYFRRELYELLSDTIDAFGTVFCKYPLQPLQTLQEATQCWYSLQRRLPQILMVGVKVLVKIIFKILLEMYWNSALLYKKYFIFMLFKCLKEILVSTKHKWSVIAYVNHFSLELTVFTWSVFTNAWDNSSNFRCLSITVYRVQFWTSLSCPLIRSHWS